MILEVRKYPDEILKRRAKKVDEITPEIKELIFNMAETLRQTQGSGLAANQVGLSIRLFVALVESKFYAIINPEIIKQSKEISDMEEGCLSIPGIYGDVPRPAEIVLSGYDKNGKRLKIKASGLRARVFQHETDHLNGILFIDKAKNFHEYRPDEK